jgi:Mitochondrial ribosomal protein mL59
MVYTLAARKANAIALLSRFAQRQARAQIPRVDGKRWRIHADKPAPFLIESKSAASAMAEAGSIHTPAEGSAGRQSIPSPSAGDAAGQLSSRVEQPNPFFPTKDAKGRTVPPVYSARRVKKLVEAAEALKGEYTVEMPALPRRLIPREERDTAGRLFHQGTTPFDKFYRGRRWERDAPRRKAERKERLAAQPQRIGQWKEVSRAFGFQLSFADEVV